MAVILTEVISACNNVLGLNSGFPVMINAENFRTVAAAKQSECDMANMVLISEAFIMI